MTVIREGNLEFYFGGTWRVRKYDENGSFYKTLMVRVEPTKAVDFLCLSDGGSLLMLEVKDFRRGVPDSEKFKKVPMTVAIKARDTVAGIVGGSHSASDRDELDFFKEARNRMSKAPRIIYFFEDLDTPARHLPKRELTKKNVLLKELKQRLRWLTKEIVVVGLNDYQEHIDDLTVRSR